MGVGENSLVFAVDVGGEMAAVLVEVVEKGLINRLAALEVDEHAVDGADAAAGLDLFHAGEEAFEGAPFDGSAAEGREENIPLRHIVVEVEAEFLNEPAIGVAVDRHEGAVVEAELFKVGEDGEGDALVPGVAFGLKDGVVIVVDVDDGFFGFDDKAREAVDPEEVIDGAVVHAGGFGGLNFVFDDDVGGGRTELFGVSNIPAKRFEKRIDVALADVGFLGFFRFERFDVGAESSDKIDERFSP